MSCGAATSRSPGAPSMTAVIASGVPLTTRRSPGVTRSVSAGGATTNRAVRAARTAVGAARPAAIRTPASAPPAHRNARRRSSGSTTRASSSRASASTASACTIAPSGLYSTAGSSALRSVASSSGHCSSTRRAMRSTGGCACARFCTHQPATPRRWRRRRRPRAGAASARADAGDRRPPTPAAHPRRRRRVRAITRVQRTRHQARARPSSDCRTGSRTGLTTPPPPRGVRRAIRLSTTSVNAEQRDAVAPPPLVMLEPRGLHPRHSRLVGGRTGDGLLELVGRDHRLVGLGDVHVDGGRLAARTDRPDARSLVPRVLDVGQRHPRARAIAEQVPREFADERHERRLDRQVVPLTSEVTGKHEQAAVADARLRERRATVAEPGDRRRRTRDVHVTGLRNRRPGQILPRLAKAGEQRMPRILRHQAARRRYRRVAARQRDAERPGDDVRHPRVERRTTRHHHAPAVAHELLEGHDRSTVDSGRRQPEDEIRRAGAPPAPVPAFPTRHARRTNCRVRCRALRTPARRTARATARRRRRRSPARWSQPDRAARHAARRRRETRPCR